MCRYSTYCRWDGKKGDTPLLQITNEGFSLFSFRSHYSVNCGQRHLLLSTYMVERFRIFTKFKAETSKGMEQLQKIYDLYNGPKQSYS